MKQAMISLAMVLLASAGCDDASMPASSDTATASHATTQPVQRAFCPLCEGHEIDILRDTPRADFEGKTYYFCSTGCRDVFVESPAKYAPRAATSPTTTQADRRYGVFETSAADAL